MFTFPFTMMSSADDAYQPAGALYFDGSADTLSKTFASAGTEETWTFSCWVKRGSIGVEQNIFGGLTSNKGFMKFDSSDRLDIMNENTDGSRNSQRITNRVYRDPTSWLHLVVQNNTPVATPASDRIKVWVNGELLSGSGDFYGQANLNQNEAGLVNTANTHYFGRNSSAQYLNASLADAIFVDAVAYVATDFGEYDSDTGIWVPKDPSTLTFNDNSFWLAFDDPSYATYGVGKDSSGRGNHFTPSSISATNIVVDGPANSTDKEVTIYSSFDPLQSGSGTLSNNNLTVSLASYNQQAFGNLPMTSGKYYWEATPTNGSTNPQVVVGICDHRIVRGSDPWSNAYLWGYKTDNGDVRHNGSNNSYGSAYGQGDIIGIAFDADNGALYFRENNGSWENSGNPTSGASKTGAFTTNITAGNVYFPHVGSQIASPARTINIAFAEASWTYSAPTGYTELKKTLTGGTGNAATWNPLAVGDNATLSNGNLSISGNNAGSTSTTSTVAMAAGKFYMEAVVTYVNDFLLSITSASNHRPHLITTSNSYTMYLDSSFTYVQKANGGTTVNLDMTKPTSGADILQIAYDADAGKVWFGKNNTWSNSGNPSAGSNENYSSITGPMVFGFRAGSASGTTSVVANFGQKPFIYTPPTDFVGASTQNLAETTVTDASKHFKAVTFSGSGSAQNVDTIGFRPDLLAIKSATSSANFNWIDSARGANELLWSNSNAATADESSSVTGFRDEGFSVGSDTGSYVNISGQTMIAYGFKAGGAPSTDNVSDSGSPGQTPTNNSVFRDGAASTTAFASANIYPTRASIGTGLSILKYTGNGSSDQTLATGLTGAAHFALIKRHTAGGDWAGVWIVGSTIYSGEFNNATKETSISDQVKAFGSGTITIDGGSANDSAAYSAYIFQNTTGLIDTGTFTGNNSTSGPFVYTGFEPAFLLVRRMDSGNGDWYLTDSGRNPYNPVTHFIRPHSATAQDSFGTASNFQVDYLSNGFRPVSTNGSDWNGSGVNFCYLCIGGSSAFASNNRAR